MDNILQARNYALKILRSQMDVKFANDGIEHIFAVSAFASLLASKRNQPATLVVIAAYLHDLATYQSHYANDHAKRSAALVKPFLEEETTLSNDETLEVLKIIASHSDKEVIDEDPLVEILKDADCISHVIMNGYDGVSSIEQERYSKSSL